MHTVEVDELGLGSGDERWISVGPNDFERCRYRELAETRFE